MYLAELRSTYDQCHFSMSSTYFDNLPGTARGKVTKLHHRPPNNKIYV